MNQLERWATEFPHLTELMGGYISSYWRRIEALPVKSPALPGETLRALPEHAPETGEGEALWGRLPADLDRVILPGLTHWQHPMFFAYFPSNISPPAIMGDLLSGGLGVQGMLWATSPACTELEMRVLDWLGEAIGLPDAMLFRAGGGGVINGTASEAIVSVLAAARWRVLRGIPDPRRREAASRLVVYASTQAHSSIVKGAMIVGIAMDAEDRERVRLIETDETYAMRPDALREAMRADRRAGLLPCLVCATVGTTGSTAVDAIDAIASAMRDAAAAPSDSADADVWLHVDAAHAGAACICPEMRWLLRGIERADSLAFNPHKWLLTNFDCDCLWLRDREALTRAMSVTPEYLRTPETENTGVVDYRDWHVPLGRRFRALKLWLVMRYFGLEGLRSYVHEHLRLAELFEGLVRGDARFELASPRTVNLVCFRLRPCEGERPEDTDARNRSLLASLNASGRLYLTHTVLPALPGRPARYVLRMAIGGVATGEEHVRRAWALIQEACAGRVPRQGDY
jgi:aromatic-L-amino-acid decarboxylase